MQNNNSDEALLAFLSVEEGANWTNFKQASDVALAVSLNPGRDGEWGGACGWWGECEVWGVG